MGERDEMEDGSSVAGLAETILYLKVFSTLSGLLTYTQFALYTGQRFIQSAHVLTANVIYS